MNNTGGAKAKDKKKEKPGVSETKTCSTKTECAAEEECIATKCKENKSVQNTPVMTELPSEKKNASMMAYTNFTLANKDQDVAKKEEEEIARLADQVAQEDYEQLIKRNKRMMHDMEAARKTLRDDIEEKTTRLKKSQRDEKSKSENDIDAAPNPQVKEFRQIMADELFDTHKKEDAILRDQSTRRMNFLREKQDRVKERNKKYDTIDAKQKEDMSNLLKKQKENLDKLNKDIIKSEKEGNSEAVESKNKELMQNKTEYANVIRKLTELNDSALASLKTKMRSDESAQQKFESEFNGILKQEMDLYKKHKGKKGEDEVDGFKSLYTANKDYISALEASSKEGTTPDKETQAETPLDAAEKALVKAKDDLVKTKAEEKKKWDVSMTKAREAFTKVINESEAVDKAVAAAVADAVEAVKKAATKNKYLVGKNFDINDYLTETVFEN